MTFSNGFGIYPNPNFSLGIEFFFSRGIQFVVYVGKKRVLFWFDFINRYYFRS